MMVPFPKAMPYSCGSDAVSIIGEIYDDALPVHIHEETLEQILDYSENDKSQEIGGFLLGGLHIDEIEYIEIRHFLPAQMAHSRMASLTFTHETWARMTREVDEQFPDAVVLGWHHTHPNFGVFLSAYDLFIHRHFFSEPWQVALVVDPLRQEFGFFQWRQDAIVDCGFICVGEELGAAS